MRRFIAVWLMSDAVPTASPFDERFSAESPPPKPQRSWLPTCLLGCLGVLLVSACLCGLVGVWAVRNAGTWAANFARAALVNAVNESQLESAEKKAIVAQIDRVVEQYKAGQITNVDLQRILEELGQSPLMGALIVYGIETKYVQTSGLSDAEKAAARLSLQRVLRGLHEKKIVLQALDAALDKVCRKDSAGNRQLKERVKDQDRKSVV